MFEPLLRPLRSTARATGFAGLTAAAVYGFQAAARVRPSLDDGENHFRVVHAWSTALFPVLGVRVHRVRGTPPPAPGPYLVVANHRSPLDILLTIHLVGGCVLSHEGVASWPILGDACRAAETIFVDRESSRSGARAIREVRARLRRGRNVIVFPEGNTFAGDEVRPFKAGVFAAARSVEGVRVLPVGLAYPPGAEFVQESFPSHLWRMSARPRTPVWIAFGEPVAVPSARREGEVRAVVQALVDAAAHARDRASTRTRQRP